MSSRRPRSLPLAMLGAAFLLTTGSCVPPDDWPSGSLALSVANIADDVDVLRVELYRSGMGADPVVPDPVANDARSGPLLIEGIAPSLYRIRISGRVGDIPTQSGQAQWITVQEGQTTNATITLVDGDEPYEICDGWDNDGDGATDADDNDVDSCPD